MSSTLGQVLLVDPDPYRRADIMAVVPQALVVESMPLTVTARLIVAAAEALDPAVPFPDIPVIVMVRAGEMALASQWFEKGAEDVLITPAPNAEVAIRVRAALSRARQRRVVAVERERSEHLLRSMLPNYVVDWLRGGPGHVADAFEDVTVLFTDLIGFTEYSSHHAPGEVVGVLDSLFTRFDTLAHQLGIEKIKTLGDGYMAVCGLPEPRHDHAHAMVDFAIALRDLVRQYRTAEGAQFGLRLGIASGPVVAGVIGDRRPAYDLWGDTVNTASRMESYGVPNEVQIHESTRALLGDAFVSNERPPLEIKGKGLMRTWLVSGRRRRWSMEFRVADLPQTDHGGLVDEHTGLLSPRGFEPLALRLRRTTARRGSAIIAIMGIIDLANSPVDPTQADRAATITARAFHEAFRDTDVIGRIESGTFIVLGAEKAEAALAVMEQRVKDRLAARTNDGNANVVLRLASTRWAAEDRTSLEELIASMKARLS